MEPVARSRRWMAHEFGSRGAATRDEPLARDRVWKVAATLRFESEDERYRWLHETLGCGRASSMPMRTARLPRLLQTPLTRGPVVNESPTPEPSLASIPASGADGPVERLQLASAGCTTGS